MFDSDNDLLSDAPLGAGKAKGSVPEEGAEARLIAELERQSIEQIRQVRAHERFHSKINVELRPGNASARDGILLVGKTSDISEGGCSAIFPAAVLPGDIFELQFDAKSLDLPIVFAHAMRCRMLKAGSFEVGFRFFTPITLKPASQASDDLFG